VPIHVNIIMIINIILHRCVLTDSDEKRWGAYSTGKREKGVSRKSWGIFYNISRKSVMWIYYFILSSRG
jgi:hypothetical protein